MTPECSGGQLYIVATPIGNLADMVPRAVETLQTADLIAAEDTRHSARLLAHFDISTPMVAYHDHSDDQAVQQLIDKLMAGSIIALISDAGTPLISDPGYRVVAKARAQGIKVTPIPGACALIAALSASGLPTNRFRFDGFLPAKTVARSKYLQELMEDTATSVFYEAPHRLLPCLEDMSAVLGGVRHVVVAREISKTFETFLSGSLDEVIQTVKSDSNQQRGEVVVMIAGADKRTDELDKPSRELLLALIPHMPLKQAAGIVAQHHGVKKNALYQWGLEQK